MTSIKSTTPLILSQNDQLSSKIKESLEKSSYRKPVLRTAAGKVWEDPYMNEWPDNDFRIYVGNLGNEVDDKVLHQAFSNYKSLTKWRVVRDHHDYTKGFGFVSFLDPHEGVKALKEMNKKYIGQRPCKLTKSTAERRNLKIEK